MTKFIHKKLFKQNNYIVPERYFEQFESELYHKLGIDPPMAENSKPTKKINLKIHHIASAAAIFVFGLLLSWYIISGLKMQSENIFMENAELYFNKLDIETLCSEIEEETLDDDFFSTEENQIDEPLLISALSEK